MPSFQLGSAIWAAHEMRRMATGENAFDWINNEMQKEKVGY